MEWSIGTLRVHFKQNQKGTEVEIESQKYVRRLQNRRSQLLSPKRNTNLTTIHRQKYLIWILESQWEYIILVKLKNKKRLIEKLRTNSFTHITAFPTWHNAELREILSAHKFSHGEERMNPLINPDTSFPHLNLKSDLPVDPTTRPAQERGNCFFTCTDTIKRLQGSQRIMETLHHERNKKAPITDPEKRISTNCLLKNSK